MSVAIYFFVANNSSRVLNIFLSFFFFLKIYYFFTHKSFKILRRMRNLTSPRDRKGREGKGRDGKGREGTGREGTGRDGKVILFLFSLLLLCFCECFFFSFNIVLLEWCPILYIIFLRRKLIIINSSVKWLSSWMSLI